MATKNVPLDANGRVAAGCTSGFSTGFDADGDWQAVTIPSGQECKGIIIQCRADDTEVYTHLDDPKEFHFSFNSDGTYFNYTHGLELSIAKDAGEIVGYVRAASGYKMVITGVN